MSQEFLTFTSLTPVATTPGIMAHLSGRVVVMAGLLLAGGALAQGDAARALSQVPGFDFSSLPAPAQRELLSVLTDEFDYCGRPATLLGSLKKGDACQHTRRMVGLAARQVSQGAVANEVIVSLSRYNQTFGRPRAKFQPDERQCLGPKDAKVTLVEFSDFECPHCAAARPVLEAFAKKKQNVRLCWQPFPLPHFKHAIIAGQAALFARDGGRFWELHDAMFENQLALSEDFIKGLLKKNGLDVKAFQKAVDARQYLDELQAGQEAGRKAGVEATPTVYVNGRKLTLQPTPEALNLAVDDELDWLAGNGAWAAN